MTSKAQMKAVRKYEDKSYFKFLTRFKKSDEEAIRKRAEEKGMSLNGYITDLIMKDLGR